MVQVSNLLTWTRIVLLAPLWCLALLEERILLGVLLAIALGTDAIDGYVARKLGEESAYGASLDSRADNLIYISVICWLPLLFWNMVAMYWIPILVTVILLLSPLVFGLVYYRKQITFHLYTSKLSAIIGGVFYLHALFFEYSPILLWLTLLLARTI